MADSSISFNDADSSHRSKKPRLEDPFAQRRTAYDVASNRDDLSGFLCGTIINIFPPNKRFRIFVVQTVQDDGVPHRFDVKICPPAMQALQQLKLAFKDTVWIALRGAVVEEIAESSKPYFIPMRLVYSDGIILRVIDRVTKVDYLPDELNTFIARSRSASPPLLRKPTLQLSGAIQISPLPRNTQDSQPRSASIIEDPHIHQQTEMNSQSDTVPQRRQTSASPMHISPQSSPIPASLILGSAEIVSETHVTAHSQPETQIPAFADTVAHEPIPVDIQLIPGSRTRDTSPALIKNELSPITIPAPIGGAENPTMSRNAGDDPALSLMPGFVNDNQLKYVSLDSVHAAVSKSVYNVVGIVRSASPPEPSKNGSPYCTLQLIDPSNWDVADGSPLSAFKVTCFTERHIGWLPQPKVGDIVILRGIKSSNGQLIAYKDHLKFACYDPSSGGAYDSRGNAPEREGFGPDGAGMPYSPFLELDEKELEYALILGDWWKAAKKIVDSKTILIGEESMMGSASKIHRLISEASPYAQPDGFFKATVEIHRVFAPADGWTCEVYVTDYTSNKNLFPSKGPPILSDKILKIEMNPTNCGSLVRTMLPGEYWAMDNIRMVEREGFWEGRNVEAHKLRRIATPDGEGTPHSHLAALLKRKQECVELDRPQREFAFGLIEAISEPAPTFINLTVEVIHIEKCYIYVTDYTRNERLAPLPGRAPWAKNLEHAILAVELQGRPLETMSSISSGDYFTLKNVGLKHISHQLRGKLGGQENLIEKMNPSSQSENLAALLERKAKWRRALIAPKKRANGHASPQKHYIDINDIKAYEPTPMKFRMKARIIDFYPPNLLDATSLWCSNCEKEIPKDRKVCIPCEEEQEGVDKHCRLGWFLRLKDEDGNTLEAGVTSTQCSFLQGLPLQHFVDNPDTFFEFKRRLEPFIGNLLEVHEHMEANLPLPVSSPMIEAVLTKREIDFEGERIEQYILTDLGLFV